MAETVHKKINKSQLKNPSKYVGKVDFLEARSSWEWSMFQFLDTCESILEWSSEEIVIPYINPIDRKTHRYFPDFFLKYKTHQNEIREAIIEIKPSHEAKAVENEGPRLTEGMSMKSKTRAVQTFVINKAKWNAAKDFCSKRGWKFFVLTEADICFFGRKRV